MLKYDGNFEAKHIYDIMIDCGEDISVKNVAKFIGDNVANIYLPEDVSRERLIAMVCQFGEYKHYARYNY